MDSNKVALLQISVALLIVQCSFADSNVKPRAGVRFYNTSSVMRQKTCAVILCAVASLLKPPDCVQTGQFNKHVEEYSAGLKRQLRLAPRQDRAGRVVPDGSHQDAGNTRNPPGEIPHE